MRRRDFIKGISVWAASPFRARAQPREQKRRVAVLMGGLFANDSGGQAEAIAFEAGLRELGWKPGVVLVTDPLFSGFVQSLRRPGGSVTGFSLFESSVGGKWLALLKEAAPAVSRVSLLFNPETVDPSTLSLVATRRRDRVQRHHRQSRRRQERQDRRRLRNLSCQQT